MITKFNKYNLITEKTSFNQILSQDIIRNFYKRFNIDNNEFKIKEVNIKDKEDFLHYLHVTNLIYLNNDIEHICFLLEKTDVFDHIHTNIIFVTNKESFKHVIPLNKINSYDLKGFNIDFNNALFYSFDGNITAKEKTNYKTILMTELSQKVYERYNKFIDKIKEFNLSKLEEEINKTMNDYKLKSIFILFNLKTNIVKNN